ncbi:MAG: right-handed parallel beta-helix repeat-containing protein, partial [Ignavibacteria bacterium]|nr:right-handed parallel beta-helix repeat-containing protein [Ignavibacteria bacterium]
MKKLFVLFAFLITVLFSYTVIAQELGSLRRGYELTIPEKVENLTPAPLHAGTYTIGNGGYFPTIQSAFDKLSSDGIDGEVTLELINTTYVALSGDYGFFLNGPIPGADLSSRVIIRPAANKNVTIIGNRAIVLLFINTSYITLDGVDTEGPTTLTIRATENLQFPYNDCVGFWNNSDHNVVQNITFISEDYTRSGTGIMIWNQTISLSPPDDNLIRNNFIKEAGVGIFLLGYGIAITRPDGNIIRGNKIGSETDNLIAWGIQSEVTLNTIIEKNVVQNVRYYNDYFNVGINAYGGYGNIIRNNVVHNIYASGGLYGTVGIVLSGLAGEQGSNNLVYNNMVYDIRSSATQTEATVAGIQLMGQYYPRVYYNSVYLDGFGNGANPDGSGALYIYGDCSNVVVKNNILVNTRDESPYCASSIYFYGNSSMITSDYNDLYYVQNPNNCLVRSTGGDYFNLAEWQVTGQDVNSITEKPFFINPHLHMNHIVPTNIESGATPIWGITKDIDGDSRQATLPDIGADEFNGVIVPVELTSFTAMVNGKEILLSWSTASELNNL